MKYVFTKIILLRVNVKSQTVIRQVIESYYHFPFFFFFATRPSHSDLDFSAIVIILVFFCSPLREKSNIHHRNRIFQAKDCLLPNYIDYPAGSFEKRIRNTSSWGELQRPDEMQLDSRYVRAGVAGLWQFCEPGCNFERQITDTGFGGHDCDKCIGTKSIGTPIEAA